MILHIKTHLETIPPMDVFYLRRTGCYGEENALLMKRFQKWMKTHHLYSSDTVILALALDNPETTPPDSCRYDVCSPLCREFLCLEDIPSDIKTRQLAGGSYLVFELEHTAKAIQEAWAKFPEKLNRLGYQLDPSRPVMERYFRQMVENHLCQLCVPIL